MSKNTKIALIVIGIMAFLIPLIVLMAHSGAFAGTTAVVEETSDNTSFSPYIPIFMAWIPIFAGIASMAQPTYSVQSVLWYTKGESYPLEKKKKNLKPYVTKEFLETEKCEIFLSLGRCKTKSLKHRAEGDRNYVDVELKDGRKLEFEIVKLEKDNSYGNNGSIKWLINKCAQIEE